MSEANSPRPHPTRSAPDAEGAHDEGPSRRGPLIALVVVVVLVAGGIWLSQTLRQGGRIQDCVMAGRQNCAPVAK
jgi:hypothetical protein